MRVAKSPLGRDASQGNGRVQRVDSSWGGGAFGRRATYQRIRLLALLAIVSAVGVAVMMTLPVVSNQRPAGAGSADPVIAAAGDIACDPANSNFNGGLGSSGSCRQKYTSDLIVSAGLAGVLLLGDNQYYCGGYQAFLQSYDLSWGRVKSITHPAVGNHEYLTSGGTDCNAANAGAAGYFNYFGAAAGQPGQGYYSYDIGTWHLIALNSQCSAAGGCGATSPQGKWLQADLAAHTNYCTLAYWHIPLFSSGGRSATNSRSFWDALYAADADVVLSSHDHLYERFAPQTPSGVADPVRGIREFVVGSGGANHTSFTSTIFANSEVRNDTTYGVLKLTLHPSSYDWQFVPEAGATFSDSGTTACHGSTQETEPPTAPSNLMASAVSPVQINLTWSASTDNVAVAGYRIFRDGVQIATSSAASYLDTDVQPSTNHSYYVVAFDAAGNASPQSNTAAATTPDDTSSPTVPTNLTATAAGPTQVNLTWAASTDNVAVAGYRVVRDGTQIATSTSASYTDTSVLPSTTYAYYVIAFDAGGNASQQSNAASVTTPPAQPTTLVFTPTDDTYVEKKRPTKNFGASTQIIADNSPIKNLLLKFSVSGIGSQSVLSAKLRLYCVDPSPFGGDFHRVADTTWSQGTANWNNAPAADSASLGTLGAVASGTWYEVDVTSLITGDGSVSLKATSTNANGVAYSSREGTTGFAPQLVVSVQ